jgi:hypothetical protein
MNNGPVGGLDARMSEADRLLALFLSYPKDVQATVALRALGGKVTRTRRGVRFLVTITDPAPALVAAAEPRL